jgi:hypothetical protein
VPTAPVIGKIERVPLRDVWKHEALDLTRWLEDNIDVLNDVLEVNLANVEREKAAGAFKVDLTAEDDSGGIAVIENQLERSNHDHLGKLITYAAFSEARIAIWIVADPRPEHVRAISWLNDSAPTDFYLVKIEGVRIVGAASDGRSLPAPLLTLIVGPSDESREAGEAKKERAERFHIRRRFWTGLLDTAKAKTKLHAGVGPGEHHWIGTGAGRSGLTFNYVVTQHAARAELYIDRGQGAEDENIKIFDHLHAHRNEIEAAFGEPLLWEPLEGKRACRVALRTADGGYEDESEWPEVQAHLIDAMIRLEKALRPYIDGLQP